MPSAKGSCPGSITEKFFTGNTALDPSPPAASMPALARARCRHWQRCLFSPWAPQVDGKLFGRLVAAVRVLVQALEDDGLKRRGDASVHAAGCGLGLVQDLVRYLQTRTAKGSVSGSHCVEHGSGGPDVSATIQLLSPHLLRRHVGQRAGKTQAFAQASGSGIDAYGHEELCHAKFQNLQLPVGCDMQVRWFQVG